MRRVVVLASLSLLVACASPVGVKSDNPDLAFDLAAFIDPTPDSGELSDGGDFATDKPHDLAGTAGHDLSKSNANPDLAGCTHIDEPLTSMPTDWLLFNAAVYDATDTRIDLTQVGQTKAAGTAFLSTQQNVTGFHAQFKYYIGGGGADGMAFVLAQPTNASGLTPTGNGDTLGFLGGMNAWGVIFDTVMNSADATNGYAGDPSNNYIGIVRSSPMNGYAYDVGYGTPPFMLSCSCTRQADIKFDGTTMTVTVDNDVVVTHTLTTPYTFTPGSYYIGFSGATGSGTDTHAVSDFHLTVGGPNCGQ